MALRKKDLAPIVMPNGQTKQPQSKTQMRRFKASGGVTKVSSKTVKK